MILTGQKRDKLFVNVNYLKLQKLLYFKKKEEERRKGGRKKLGRK